ncbi:MAG: sigma-54-dependent Fis family transcriptional regulator [Deltaproteobacteria bacterium]|nr:sigma-54-dependent Fis family transcriptional regulator [Deltaproteobacteria bacterium]
MKQKTILVVDDEPDCHRLLHRILDEEYQVKGAFSAREGLNQLRTFRPDLIILDLKMAEMGGIEFLRELKRMDSPVRTIVISAYADIASVVQAMKLGAEDFITKPFRDEKLREDIRLFFSLSEKPQGKVFRERIVGESPQIREVWKLIEKFAPSDISILLAGESGTGKEIFARSIHEMSKRSAGPFIPVDCATLPESLVESELFGHEKGAFTGADARKPGWFETAHRGTLFLDELGNLSSPIQAKLLRALQESTISPIGSRIHKSVDVRVVSATNIDLERAVSEGGFRGDLYYRLGAVSIFIPPLREREGDVALLARHFVRLYSAKYGNEIAGINDLAMALLCAYSWPGNVRELENVIKSAVLLAEEQITTDDLPPYFRRVAVSAGAGAEAGQGEFSFIARMDLSSGGRIDLKKIREQAAAEAERSILKDLLKNSSLKKSDLAKQLGVDRKTLRAKMRRLGISLKRGGD